MKVDSITKFPRRELARLQLNDAIGCRSFLFFAALVFQIQSVFSIFRPLDLDKEEGADAFVPTAFMMTSSWIPTERTAFSNLVLVVAP